MREGDRQQGGEGVEKLAVARTALVAAVAAACSSTQAHLQAEQCALSARTEVSVPGLGQVWRNGGWGGVCLLGLPAWVDSKEEGQTDGLTFEKQSAVIENNKQNKPCLREKTK